MNYIEATPNLGSNTALQYEGAGTLATGAFAGKLATAALAIALLYPSLDSRFMHKTVETKLYDDPIHLSYRDNASQDTQFVQVPFVDLTDELNRVFGLLLQNRAELDNDSHRVLYANLWKMYE
jgi:hypothetical protein